MPISLLQRLGDIPLVFVDTETTGVSAALGHRVVEVGVVRVEGGKIVCEYQQLIDPHRPIDPGASAVTGITDQMVAGQPAFADQLPRLLEIMGGGVVLGHHVGFDLSFLNKEFQLAGQNLADRIEPHVLDTVRIARRRFGRGGNGLQMLARRLGIAPSTAHRALADAQTTHRVFETLMIPAGGWNCCLCDAMACQGGPVCLPPEMDRKSLLPLELEEAMEARRPVLMEYLDGERRRTERIVEPISIRRSRGELVLVAHCRLRQERRTFKLERIVGLKRIEERPGFGGSPVADGE